LGLAAIPRDEDVCSSGIVIHIFSLPQKTKIVEEVNQMKIKTNTAIHSRRTTQTVRKAIFEN
jgi:hypothetical protein